MTTKVIPPDVRGRGIVVVVQIDLLVDDIFSGEYNDIWLATDELEVADRIGIDAGKFFLSRMDESVSDNIILGQD